MKLSIKQQQEIRRMAEKEMALIRKCKRPEEVNEIYKGRMVIVQDGGPFHGQYADFVEMVGEEARETWRMKVKTGLGNHLFLKGGQFQMIFKSIQV